MADLYPPIDPFATGMLAVGDGNLVYWETCGSPDGKPAVFLHGGPGQGIAPNMRRGFDPARYLVVLLDQRGCGRSTPHASDPAVDMTVNTTRHLISDIELLREHLGIDRWLLCGGSWGSTLALAYAQRHPDRVTQIVLSAITTSRPAETDWLYGGAARFFPEAYQRFIAGPGAANSAADTVVAAYAAVMADPNPSVRVGAAAAWAAWEDAVLSLEPGRPGRRSGAFSDRPESDLSAMVRICANYAANYAWLDDGALIRDAGLLSGIPGVLIHGRMDLSCPASTAWELARAWPDAKLLIDDGSGHGGSDVKRQWLLDALDQFARS